MAHISSHMPNGSTKLKEDRHLVCSQSNSFVKPFFRSVAADQINILTSHLLLFAFSYCQHKCYIYRYTISKQQDSAEALRQILYREHRMRTKLLCCVFIVYVGIFVCRCLSTCAAHITQKKKKIIKLPCEILKIQVIQRFMSNFNTSKGVEMAFNSECEKKLNSMNIIIRFRLK